MNKNNKKVNAKIPQKSYFIHKCYISCSKELYKNPYVFDTGKGLSPKRPSFKFTRYIDHELIME